MSDITEGLNGATMGATPKTKGKGAPKKPRPKVKAAGKGKKAKAKVKAVAKKGNANMKGRGGKKGFAPGGDKKAEAARRVHHKVIASGKPFDSVFKAFEGLKLPLGSHQTFRKKLKAAGSLDFVKEDGKTVKFKLASKE